MTTLQQYNSRAQALNGNPQFRGVVISVHGINTTGPWQKSISPILQKHSFLSTATDYGFARLKVLRPKALLNRAMESLYETYEEHLTEELPYSVIGHSFGTLAVGTLLTNNRDIHFDRVILAGCILDAEFKWDQIIEGGQASKVLNEVSTDDWVVKYSFLLKAIAPTLRVGDSGRNGFQYDKPELIQRHHKLGHSGVLNEVACNKTWVPFLRGEN